jgi:hypothetical protein
MKFLAMNHNAPAVSCPFPVNFLVEDLGRVVPPSLLLMLLVMFAARPPMLVARMRGYEAAMVEDNNVIWVRGRRRSGRVDGVTVVIEALVLAFIWVRAYGVCRLYRR